MKGQAVKRKGFIAQLFCKHEWWVGHKSNDGYFNVSGDTKIEVCCKCGKIRKEYFVLNVDGS